MVNKTQTLRSKLSFIMKKGVGQKAGPNDPGNTKDAAFLP